MMIPAKLVRMIVTIGTALAVAAVLYFTHPEWFRNTSVFTLPQAGRTPTAGPTVPAPRTTATPATPLVGMTQHLDGIWVTPFWVEHSQGTSGILPNMGDEFIIVHVRIKNLSQSDYPVHLQDFQVLDSHGQLDPPLTQNFTRRRLREVHLVPLGHTEGTMIFEVPTRDTGATLMYQPEPLDPTKRKEWLLR
jgi:hypothetical protein